MAYLALSSISDFNPSNRPSKRIQPMTTNTTINASNNTAINTVSLASLLSQHKQVILAIPSDGELSYMNDDSSEDCEDDWTNHYLATITSQYILNGAYIAFDCECLVSVNDTGYVTIEEYDTSQDAYAIHCGGIGNIEDTSGHFYEIDNNEDFAILEAEHEYRIITDKPDFMSVEWY